MHTESSTILDIQLVQVGQLFKNKIMNNLFSIFHKFIISLFND